MKYDTFYRMLHDAKLPCQHCGHMIDMITREVHRTFIRDGRPEHRPACSKCGEPLPQFEMRDYGVPIRASEWSELKGLPDPRDAKRRPLWMI